MVLYQRCDSDGLSFVHLLIPQSAPERADVKMGGLAVEVELGRPPGIDSARETLLTGLAN